VPPLFTLPLKFQARGVCASLTHFFCAVTFIGHPFDTVKIRLQSQRTGHEIYKSTFHCARHIVKKEGFRGGLYAGVASPLIGQMFFRAGSFLTFHSVSERVTALAPPETVTDRYRLLLLSGAVTGSIITFIETPIDLVKTKLQTTFIKTLYNKEYYPPFVNFRTCVSYLYGRYGALGLFQGFQGTMARNIPANALFFPVNEITKDQVMLSRGYESEEQLAFMERLACGGVAGLSYWVSTCPLDCIKTQCMMLPLSEIRSRKLTFGKIVRNMYKEGGVMRFYQGLFPLALRSVPACGLMFATVDWLRHQLGKL